MNNSNSLGPSPSSGTSVASGPHGGLVPGGGGASLLLGTSGAAASAGDVGAGGYVVTTSNQQQQSGAGGVVPPPGAVGVTMGGGPPPGAPAAPLHNNGVPPPPGTVPPNHVKMMHAPGATISMLGPAQPHHYGHIYPAPPAVAGENPNSSSAFFGSQHLQAPATRSNHLVAMQQAQAQQHASRGGGSGPPGAQAQNMLQHQQAAGG
eukprot:GSA25T00007437001.1